MGKAYWHSLHGSLRVGADPGSRKPRRVWKSSACLRGRAQRKESQQSGNKPSAYRLVAAPCFSVPHLGNRTVRAMDLPLTASRRVRRLPKDNEHSIYFVQCICIPVTTIRCCSLTFKSSTAPEWCLPQLSPDTESLEVPAITGCEGIHP